MGRTANYAVCDVDLCSLYTDFIPLYPAEKYRKQDGQGEAEREGEKWKIDAGDLFGFLCLHVKPREALTEM